MEAQAREAEEPRPGRSAPLPPLVCHVLGHPNLPLDVAGEPANAQVLNCHYFRLMLKRAGIRFFYYGMSGSGVDPGAFVDLGRPTGTWTYGNAWHREYSQRASNALAENLVKEGDGRNLVISLYGCAHADIRTGDHPVIEAMIGYDHCWAPYCVFPSYAHQHAIYTAQEESVRETKWFDTVIPHFVDPDEYTIRDRREGYILYLGRKATDKGITLAEEACRGAGLPLRKVHTGYTGARKAKLIGEAAAVIMPTVYIEPFGYVAIEAQMCGVPVVTTDWGAFAETVEHAVTGFRCRTQAEFVKALHLAPALPPGPIRDRAVALYGMDAIWPKYRSYFEFVWKVHTEGGYYAPSAVRW